MNDLQRAELLLVSGIYPIDWDTAAQRESYTRVIATALREERERVIARVIEMTEETKHLFECRAHKDEIHCGCMIAYHSHLSELLDGATTTKLPLKI